jgi:lambda repressor-like predicted transcriptional regulator
VPTGTGVETALTPGDRDRKAAEARKAAGLHLDEGISIATLRERFGLSRSTLWEAIDKLRRERERTEAP